MQKGELIVTGTNSITIQLNGFPVDVGVGLRIVARKPCLASG